MLDEQAVLSGMLGPFKSKYQLNLLAKIEKETPVTVLEGASSGSLEIDL